MGTEPESQPIVKDLRHNAYEVDQDSSLMQGYRVQATNQEDEGYTAESVLRLHGQTPHYHSGGTPKPEA
ncbi:MAG TPA: hypothetical protein PKE42_04835 [Arachnia sp.]|nr:hypothetical protein [Arachnia sp.]